MATSQKIPDAPKQHKKGHGYCYYHDANGVRKQKTFPGKFGSEKMWNAFRKWRADLAGEYHSQSPQNASRSFATVEDVWCAFHDFHAKRRLAGDAKQTRSDKRYMNDVECVGRMLQPYQHIESNKFDSQMLDEVLENERLKTGNGTKRLNDKLQFIQKCFKFGVRKNLVDSATYGSLLTVEKFNKLDRHIKQPGTRVPCSEADLMEALAHASPTIHTMLMVASLTGMRSDNVCKLSWDEIDTSREEADGVWLYKPLTHKTAHMGKELTVVLGTKCIQALRRYEEARPDKDHPYIFNPHANYSFCRWQQGIRQRKTKEASTHGDQLAKLLKSGVTDSRELIKQVKNLPSALRVLRNKGWVINKKRCKVHNPGNYKGDWYISSSPTKTQIESLTAREREMFDMMSAASSIPDLKSRFGTSINKVASKLKSKGIEVKRHILPKFTKQELKLCYMQYEVVEINDAQEPEQPEQTRTWQSEFERLHDMTNGVYSPDTFRQAVLRIVNKHNIQRFVIHQLRHYHSNNVFQHYAEDNGVERQQAVIGHHTEAMTNKYTLRALELAIKTQREIG